jgi:hypothetical protein
MRASVARSSAMLAVSSVKDSFGFSSALMESRQLSCSAETGQAGRLVDVRRTIPTALLRRWTLHRN